MYDPYKKLGNLISDLDADISILECMTMNGENEKANSYLMGAKLAIQNALSNVSENFYEMRIRILTDRTCVKSCEILS